MIPYIDHIAIVAELNSWGLRDFKIDTVCGFTGGYTAQIKCGNVKRMSHEYAVRLYNFWEAEATLRGIKVPVYASPDVSRGPLHTQAQSVTT